MDRFEDLQAFVAVVETGSFTAAADRLETAKSAVSRRISALEERLGVQLLRRTTRQLNVTDAGRSFYEQGVRVLADLDEAESSVLKEHGELRGTLRVALPLTFGIRHMHEPIAAFSRLHPQLRFDLNLDDRRIDLVEEGIDVALRIGRLPDSSLIARRLFEVRSVVCGSPDYFKQHGIPATLADLKNHNCLIYGNLAEPNKWVCRDSNGKSIRIDVAGTMTANNGDFLNAASAQGLGIALQPTFIAGELMRRGELIPVLTNYEWPVSAAYAVYPATRHLSRRVRELIDFLVEYFSGVPSWDQDCARCPT
ncbi:MAG: LysR family transcriptional regulator [Gammaproteobacteria bacterium]|nr:LysR family transcriptional regulator [Gammaproteobacteria bacterium]MDH5302921.1 LysR family transcriptional regulator [Gammaproteobacteria bacterium]MDH5323492.1 LysR family transcriptional regulator [Gammaproteobacteria bacterium]